MVEAFTECLTDSGESGRHPGSMAGDMPRRNQCGKKRFAPSTTLCACHLYPVTRVENFCASGTESFRERYMRWLPALMIFAWLWVWKS